VEREFGTERSRKICPNKHLVLCQESEGEVTQGEAAGIDRSDRVYSKRVEKFCGESHLLLKK